VREGVIAFEYIPLTTGSIPNAVGASKAALCAGEQGAFFEYHDALFDWHSRYGMAWWLSTTLDSACRVIEGTARSMGVEIEA